MTFPTLSAPKVTVHNGKAVTTSQAVAEYFNKRHDDVLKKLRALECSTDFSARNFAEAEYKDEQGKKRPMYEMTKDGFVFLVMGFTGKKAAAFKEAYIAEFNRMESECQPNKSSFYTQQHREPLDNNDLANIKWLISAVTNRFKYQESWNQGIWYALRRATGTPSPHPFSVEDLPVLADEFRRIVSVTSNASNLICSFEREILKQVLRNRKDYDLTANQLHNEFKSLQLSPQNTRTLERFEELGIARLEQRTR